MDPDPGGPNTYGSGTMLKTNIISARIFTETANRIIGHQRAILSIQKANI
jgi:hypothetical protein